MNLAKLLLLFTLGAGSFACSGLAYRSPTADMEPTITSRDMSIANPFEYSLDEVKRFDIVAFEAPEELKRASGETEMRLLKRIIGLPGEVVQIKNGEVYINDTKLIHDFAYYDDRDNFGPLTIPADEYFLLGDNRPVSLDSRHWNHPTVKRSQIYSKITEIKKGFYNDK